MKKEQNLEDNHRVLHTTDVVNSYQNKTTRPLEFSELSLILRRFQIMLEEDPNRYTIEEFIQQEDYRRDIFL